MCRFAPSEPHTLILRLRKAHKSLQAMKNKKTNKKENKRVKGGGGEFDIHLNFRTSVCKCKDSFSRQNGNNTGYERLTRQKRTIVVR